ncbi:MAG: hypothetical protein OEX04_17965 [Acidimicrobiia bacterium]|nr:hypothetical protein [Acidimicrobiia bacterium]MDH4309360.1 hypothetical protein [Acidimicrobiia bacterium]MDH5292443.1 hypothetical protein [Acidimicrobiia bacterium]
MRFVKLVTGFIGTLTVLLAVPILVSGIALVSWSARDRMATLPSVAVTTSERALSAADVDIFAGSRHVFLPDLGEARLRASDDQPLFVGVGPAQAVDRYLARGIGVPAEQDFWVQSSDGVGAIVDWDIEPGRWTAVVMNADGSPGVDATVQVSVPSAPLRIAGGIVAAIGAAFGVIGALLVGAAWGGGRTRRVSPTPATATQ